ncbi:enoyl-CoA hydratase/isomerase family protein [Emcibacter nanhaiensis]|uniref:Enoyl-CoA hydratase/isomerase family protein n=1 Tax=Emcibacter nanhaiensis TaxID=1505037 RepID=A0A501PD16_9PROT|nr:enoyl-CoA hydratase/isomerase family protein [Emcibacter nanhaiensis]TPD57856.1 enoyl-CoA hydratase/isomerase family protein [Emcibacter nanhaiensis]
MTETQTSEEPTVLVEEKDNDILLITLNRPRSRNALNLQVWEELDAAVRKAEGATPPRAVILTGAGGFFSAGGDLKSTPALGDGALAPAARLELGQKIIRRLHDLPVPVIAAVEGGAYGIGWSLALAGDLIISSDEARYCAPFLSLGLVPDGGCVWFLRRKLGAYQASEIILSERVVDANEASDLGLVSKLVPAGSAIDTAIKMAAGFAKGNRHSVELTKRLMRDADGSDLAASHAQELAYCSICQTGPEVAKMRAERAAKAKEKEK